MSDDAFDVTLKMTRGSSSDDKEVVTTKVSADDLEELDDKMTAVRDRMEEWSQDLREIQPNPYPNGVRDDQSQLGEVDG